MSSDSSKDLFARIILAVQSKGMEKIEEIAHTGKKKLALRSLRKDKNKMYEKLGREVERLVEAGDIDHPGLVRGVERIVELHQKIEQTSQELLEKSPEK